MSDAPVQHLGIRISGLVQGVCFRAAARREALRLGLAGFIRNERDGSVYAEAEGEHAGLDEFVRWCRRGPPDAAVERVDTEPGPLHHYSGFAIRYS